MTVQLLIALLSGIACCALALRLASELPVWILGKRGQLLDVASNTSPARMASGITSFQLLIACGLTFSLIVFAYWHDPVKMTLLTVFMVAVYVTAVIDSRTKLLFDDLVQPILWAGLVVNGFGVFTTLHEALAGAVAGYLFMWLVARICAYFMPRASVGQGDFKFMAAIGAWFGYQIVLPTLWFSAVIFAFMVFLARRFSNESQPSNEYPMGPALAVAALFTQVVMVELLVFKLPLNFSL